MMLEVARCLATSPAPPKRSVMFVGFDLEEFGLFGSRYFVAHPPHSVERVSLFVTADMIGRAVGGVCRSHVFVIGTEYIPETRKWIANGSKGRPLTVGLLVRTFWFSVEATMDRFARLRLILVLHHGREPSLSHSE